MTEFDPNVMEDVAAIHESIADAGGLVTISDLSRRWEMSKSDVHKRADRRDFPEPVQRVGRSRVWLLAECENWKEHHR
jgi:predicted DNA-binding transcriptional regulator AlpA